ncbi:MAG: carotenoid oxygenase family protein [Myxococcota bacterium]
MLRYAGAAWHEAEEQDEVTLRALRSPRRSLPAGTLFRNGPGSFSVGAARLHPLDGYGFVRRFRLDGGTVRYAARFVETHDRAREVAERRLLYRGLGTPAQSASGRLRPRFRNSANTNVVMTPEGLLALWEGGPPHVLDPDSLATRGVSSLGLLGRSAIDPLSWIVGDTAPLGAHTASDDRGTYGFGVCPGLPFQLRIYQLSAPRRCLHSVSMPGFPLIHDMGVTPSYFVFLVPSLEFRLVDLLRGSPLQSLREGGGPMQLLLVHRETGAPSTIPLTPGFAFHMAQVAEEAGRIRVDAFVSDALLDPGDTSRLFGPDSRRVLARPVRFVADLRTGTVETYRLSDFFGEFPTSSDDESGRPGVIYYASAPKSREVPYLSGVARLDSSTGDVVFRDMYPWFVGEPVPVRRGSARGEVSLLVVRTDPLARRTELLSLHGPTLETEGIWSLPQAVPPDFHGMWAQH